MPPAMPLASNHGEVEVEGATLYYAMYGAGDPVILLHGGLGNSDHWSNQVPALLAAHQVIVIDSRGQGRSTRSKAPATYDVMASDVLAVMDHLGLARASMVGGSDGGEIALKLAIHHPDRVNKVFIIGTNYDAHGFKPHGGNTTTFAAYASKCRSDYTRLSKTPKRFDELAAWLRPMWRNPMGFTKEQLRSIKAPTMVADGDHDEIIARDQIEEMATLIPNGTLRIFADTSHFALWQDPVSINKVLVEFLAPTP